MVQRNVSEIAPVFFSPERWTVNGGAAYDFITGQTSGSGGTGGAEREDNETVVWEFFTTPTMQVVIGLLVLCVLIAVGSYLVSSCRDSAASDRSEGFDTQAFLREIHREGDISDAEYRTIQSAMDGKTTRESKADDKEG